MHFGVHEQLLLVGLLLAVAAMLVTAPLLRVPYPIFLVLGGLALGFVPGIPSLSLAPDVVLVAVLPPLLYSSAFVLGAVVSPTDPIAATQIAQRLGVPRRVIAVIEGESLVNDGTALVLYKVAVTAVV